MPDDSTLAEPSNQLSVQLRTGYPHRLLIADDSPDMRWLVRAAVGDRFTEVIEVGDGRQLMWTLLRLFMTARGQALGTVVVTDLCMSAYDGLAVLDAWSELDCNVPLILITAFPSAGVHARAQELGAVVLAKPFSTTALRELIDGIIDRCAATARTPLPT